MRITNLCLTAFALLTLATYHPASAQAQYTFSTFDAPVVGDTEAYGINASGLVSGQYLDAGGNDQVFTWQNGVFTTLSVPNSVVGFAGGPNDQGQIPITWIDTSSNIHAAIGQNGSFTLLTDASGYTITAANSINNAGTIAGIVSTDPGLATASGFVYSGGTYTVFDYPGASYTIGVSVNDPGNVVGYYLDGNGTAHGFEKLGNTFTSLDFPGDTSSVAEGISNDGVIAGYYALNGSRHGYLFDNGSYTTVDVPGATDTYLSYRNSTTGTLVGYYSTDNAQTFHAFVATTPEPGSMALLIGLSISGAGFLARRCRRLS